MKTKTFIISAVSALIAITSLSSFSVSAEEIQIGEAYLETSFSESEKIEITTDGQYEITWKMSDDVNINDGFVWLQIKTHKFQYPLGVMDDVVLIVDEIWIDNVKVEESIIGQPMYAFATDSYEIWGSNADNYVASIQFVLSGENYDNITTEVNDNLKVVFSLSNLTDPDTFITDTEKTTNEIATTEPVIENSTAVENTTATDENEENTSPAEFDTYLQSTMEEYTTEAVTDNTTIIETNTTVNTDKPDSPKTGDKGVAGLFTVMLGIGGISFVLRKRDVYEKNN